MLRYPTFFKYNFVLLLTHRFCISTLYYFSDLMGIGIVLVSEVALVVLTQQLIPIARPLVKNCSHLLAV